MALPQEFLMELKYKNDIETVLSSSVDLKRRGSNLVGLCPFHNEKTPSFTVYPENGSYYCFGCGQGGDVITFVMKNENLDYMDAVRKLADRAGLKVPDSERDDKELKLKNDVYDANREAAKFFNSYMMSPEGKAGLDYFLSRGLSLKTITRFGLGFAPNDWHALEEHLKKKGFSQYVLQQADLIVKSSKTDKDGNTKTYTYDKFRNRAMFPIINLHGKVIGFGGRAMPGDDKQGGKYVNTADTPVFKKSHNMYALNFAKNVGSNQIILVEGNIDVIALHQAGFENTVAALGTSFTEEQARLLSRYTKEVIILMDSDGAGEKATDRAMDILSAQGVSMKIVRLPKAKDPDEFIKKFGAGAFEARLENAFSEVEYRLITAARGIDLAAPDGKSKYLIKACEVLAKLNNPIAAELYAGKLSEKYGVSKDALLTNIKDYSKKQTWNKTQKELDTIIMPKPQKNEVNPQKHEYRRAVAAEEAIICVLMKHPNLLEDVMQKIDAENMITEFSKRLYRKIISILTSGHHFDLVLLGGEFSPEEIGYVTKLQTSGLGDENPQRVLNDSIKVMTEERERLDKTAVTDLSDDEWANLMQKISKQKTGNK